MTTPDTAAMRARLQAATWQLIGDETPRNVQSAPGDNGRRPVLVTRWPITGAYKPVCVACLTVDGIWLGGRRRKLWFEPTHWRPLPEDPGEDAPGAALLEAYDARGEEIGKQAAERVCLVAALELLMEQLSHRVPEDCWATGPSTGDPIQDLVVCPGCMAIEHAKRTIKGVA